MTKRGFTKLRIAILMYFIKLLRCITAMWNLSITWGYSHRCVRSRDFDTCHSGICPSSAWYSVAAALFTRPAPTVRSTNTMSSATRWGSRSRRKHMKARRFADRPLLAVHCIRSIRLGSSLVRNALQRHSQWQLSWRCAGWGRSLFQYSIPNAYQPLETV